MDENMNQNPEMFTPDNQPPQQPPVAQQPQQPQQGSYTYYPQQPPAAPQAPPPPPVYQQTVYPQAPAPVKDRKGMAIASLVLGILSLLLCCVPYISIICGIIGLVLGCMSMKSSGKGMAIAGLICSAFGIIISIIIGIVALVAIAEYGEYNYYYGFDY